MCLFADHDSPIIGMGNFVMPLRSSSLRSKELRPIVIVASEEYLRREWPSLANFPDIYVKPVSIPLGI